MNRFLLRTFLRYLVALPVLGFLVIFLLYPIYAVVAGGADITMIGEVFKSSLYREGLVNALLIALGTTLISFIISLPLALLYNRFEFPGKEVCNLLIMAPMILPPFVGALGFQQLLGYYGVFNAVLTGLGFERINFLAGEGRFWAVCAIEALHLYPVLYLNLVTSLANVDPALHEAARNLGAGWYTRLRRITLPLIRPGIFAGGSIILIWSFTELGTPLMFGFTNVTPVQVFFGITELERNAMPLALTVVMLAGSSLLYIVGRLLLGRPGAASAVKGTLGASAERLAGGCRFLPLLLFCLVTFAAVLPHISLILLAFSGDWYNTVLPSGYTFLNFENALSDSLVIPSIINSLQYSFTAMLLAVLLGVLISVIVVRWKLRGGWILDALSMLPLAVPGIVMAFGFLVLSYSNPVLNTLFDVENNPLLLLAVAYAVRRLPYVVRSVSSGLEQTPEELELAARNLGAGSFTVLKRITLPLILANVIVGGLFAFSFSMLEVSDSLILAQKSEFYPITKAIYDLSQINGSGTFIACAFGVWSMLFLGSTIALAGAVLGRKIGAIFRL